LYYLVLTGNNGFLNKTTSFTCSEGVQYGNFPGVSNHTIYCLDNCGAGSPAATIVCRLNEVGYDPTSVSTRPIGLLDRNKCSISPNPATDFMDIDLHLSQMNAYARLMLIDENGKIIKSQICHNIKDDRVRLKVQDLPVGVYRVLISTEKEGKTVMPVVIGH
jgi:hypothetical protein